MPTMPKIHRPPGSVITPTLRALFDRQRRGTRTDQGYGNRWLRARARWLNDHPLCVFDERRGLYVIANVVDHIIPHRGDQVLFWDEDNWQSLCTYCHNSTKRRIELAQRRLDELAALGRVHGGGPGGVRTRKAILVEARPVANFWRREIG
jgi:hypothetical protein